MYLYFTKSLLPWFLLFSYIVVPAMAEDDDEVVGAPTSQSQPSVQPQTGLCAIDKDFFANHPEYNWQSQMDILTAGTEVDVTATVLRLIPKDQRCSKEISQGGKNSCMVCRKDATAERAMVTITQPLLVQSGARSNLLVCPNGPGTCATWMSHLDLAGGLMLDCFVDSASVKEPVTEPMSASPFLNLGIKIKVPCGNLKAVRPRETRRPW
jgi:hypothetical protein